MTLLSFIQAVSSGGESGNEQPAEITHVIVSNVATSYQGLQS